MANAYLSFSQNGLTDYLLVIAKKGSDLSTAIETKVFPFPHPTSRNIVFEDLEPVVHYFDFRASPDGVSLGSLLHVVEYDVRNDMVVGESYFYHADGLETHDPASGQPIIVDARLDGKTITDVIKDGARPLEQDIEWKRTSTGIELLGGAMFSPDEVMVIRVSYKVSVPSPPSTGGLLAYKTVTANITLDSSYDNSEIDCITASAARLTVTMRPIADIPEKMQYQFMTFDGAQINTIIKANPGDFFRYNNADVTEIILGKCEILKVKKIGTRFRVLDAVQGINNVGIQFGSISKTHVNTLLNNDQLLDGLDYPRLYDFIKNKLPAQSKVSVTDAAISTYVRFINQVGCYIVATDSTKFRMPNMQNQFVRFLANFNANGTDLQRIWDFGGGYQDWMVGPHYHATGVQNKPDAGSGLNPELNRFKVLRPSRKWNVGNGTDANQASSTDINKYKDDTENTFENRTANVGHYSHTYI